MSNVSVTTTQPVITVDSSTDAVTVGSTNQTITVSAIASVANANVITSLLSVNDTGGDGSLSYTTGTGVFTFAGPNQTEANSRVAAAPSQVRAHIGNTAPIKYSTTTGVISIDDAALFSGKTTDDLTQGSSNKYFSTSGALVNTDSLPEGNVNFYYLNARADARVNLQTGTNLDLSQKSTSNLSEGTNQYFTTARANTAVADYIGSTENGPFQFAGNLNVAGNVVVAGNLDYENVTDLYVTDRQITLNANSNTLTNNVAIVANQPLGASPPVDFSENPMIYFNTNAPIGWRFSEGRRTGANSANGYMFVKSTTDLIEGDNLYFTAARARGNISATTSGDVGTLAYNNSTGAISWAGISNSNIRALFSNGTGMAYNVSTGDIAVNTLVTQNFEKVNINSTGSGAGASVAQLIVNGNANVTGTKGIVGKRFAANANGTYFPGSGAAAEDFKTTIFDADGITKAINTVSSPFELLSNKFLIEYDDVRVTVPKTRAGSMAMSGLGDIYMNLDSNGNAGDNTDFSIRKGNANIALSTELFTVHGNSNVTSRGIITATGFSGPGTSITGLTTSQVSEGTNQYFTVARSNVAFDDRLADKTTNNLAEGGSNLYYTDGRFDTRLASKSTSNLSEGTNLYYTDGRFDTRLATKSTSNLSEGTNLYYTTARANSAIADYTGTISTGNTISGTTVTATTELKTNQVKPNSSDVITVAETNDIKLGAKISDVSYLTGNIVQAGTYIDRPTSGAGLSDGRVLTTSSAFSTAVGSTKISGMVATKSGAFGGFGVGGLSGIDGTATYVAGSPDVVVTGLQTLNTVGAPGYIFGGRTTEDPATHFRPGMQIITALSSQHQTGAMPKNAYALSLNSSDAGGNANIKMSQNATFSKTYTISGQVDQIGLFNTVENPTTGDRRALHGVDASFGVTATDFVGMSTTDHPVEGTSQLGANYFQHFSNTSLPTSINANITPSMITTANVASTAIQDIIEMKSPNGYYRFPDSVLVGDQSINTSRNNYLDSIPGFGLNIQWSGNGDTAKYGTQAQTAMTFQAFTDNALQSQSGFEDRAGPRVLLSSFTGNKNNAWQGWYPRAGQELGKFAWWSTTGESANPSTTTPPAAITAIASNDWDTDANTSTDVIHYAAAKVAGGTKQMFLAYKDGETLIGAHNSKKIKLGTGGTINTDIRANASLTAELLTVDTTETELYNRLQLYSLTTTEINALGSPQAGQIVYNSTLGQVCVYSGVASAWQKITQATM